MFGHCECVYVLYNVTHLSHQHSLAPSTPHPPNTHVHTLTCPTHAHIYTHPSLARQAFDYAVGALIA